MRRFRHPILCRFLSIAVLGSLALGLVPTAEARDAEAEQQLKDLLESAEAVAQAWTVAQTVASSRAAFAASFVSAYRDATGTDAPDALKRIVYGASGWSTPPMPASPAVFTSGESASPPLTRSDTWEAALPVRFEGLVSSNTPSSVIEGFGLHVPTGAAGPQQTRAP